MKQPKKIKIEPDNRTVLEIKGAKLDLGSAWQPAVERLKEQRTNDEIAAMTETEVFAIFNEWLSDSSPSLKA